MSIASKHGTLPGPSGHLPTLPSNPGAREAAEFTRTLEQIGRSYPVSTLVVTGEAAAPAPAVLAAALARRSRGDSLFTSGHLADVACPASGPLDAALAAASKFTAPALPDTPTRAEVR